MKEISDTKFVNVTSTYSNSNDNSMINIENFVSEIKKIR